MCCTVDCLRVWACLVGCASEMGLERVRVRVGGGGGGGGGVLPKQS